MVFNEIHNQEVEKINVFRGMLNSWLSMTVIASIVIVQVVAVEFLGPFAHVKPLSWRLRFASILIGLTSMQIFVPLKFITSSKLIAPFLQLGGIYLSFLEEGSLQDEAQKIFFQSMNCSASSFNLSEI